MRKWLLAWLLSGSSLVWAAVLSVEFNFTPFVGDVAKAKQVVSVPGKAAVFVNGVPVAEQEVDKGEMPVLFDNREVAAAVWITGGSLGPALRKGKNILRIEFTPTDTKAVYGAQLRWASITDQVSRTESGAGRVSTTNQANEGADNRKGLTGKLVMEREFVADFAADQPWHRYPPVTALSDADKQALAALVAERAALFKPDFAAAHQFLKSANTPGVQLDIDGIRKSKVLQKGYDAGLRIVAPPADKLDFVLTGNPEVAVRGKGGAPLFPPDLKAIGRIKSAELQMGLGMVMSVLYPPSLVVVRDPAGKWSVAY